MFDAFFTSLGNALTPRLLSAVGGIALACSALLGFLLQPPKVPALRTPSAAADPTRKPGLAKMVAKHAPKTGKRYVVIGTGNVGMTLVEALIERGETDVVGFDVVAPRRTPARHFRFVQGDVTRFEEVSAALEGADVVYATFAVIRYQERLAHDYASSHAVNVLGTEHVIRACVERSVPLLLQTSTSHVVMRAGMHGAEGLDEAAPYCTAKSAMNHYAWTKAQAEQLVLNANGTPLASGKGQLTAAALRPCSGIFGASDALIAELTLRNLHAKGSELVVASGTIDWIYAEDLVYAQLLCEAKAATQPETVGARAARARPSIMRAARRAHRQALTPARHRVCRASAARPCAAGGESFCISPGEPCSGWDFNLALKFYYQKASAAHAWRAAECAALSRAGARAQPLPACPASLPPSSRAAERPEHEHEPLADPAALRARRMRGGLRVPHAQKAAGRPGQAHAKHARLRDHVVHVQRAEGARGARLRAALHAGRGGASHSRPVAQALRQVRQGHTCVYVCLDS